MLAGRRIAGSIAGAALIVLAETGVLGDNAVVATAALVVGLLAVLFFIGEPWIMVWLCQGLGWCPQAASIQRQLDHAARYVVQTRWEVEQEAPQRLADDPTYILGPFDCPRLSHPDYTRYGPLTGAQADAAFADLVRLGLVKFARFDSDMNAEYEWTNLGRDIARRVATPGGQQSP